MVIIKLGRGNFLEDFLEWVLFSFRSLALLHFSLSSFRFSKDRIETRGLHHHSRRRRHEHVHLALAQQQDRKPRKGREPKLTACHRKRLRRVFPSLSVGSGELFFWPSEVSRIRSGPNPLVT